MLSFECIKNEKSVYFLLTSAHGKLFLSIIGQFAPFQVLYCPIASSREVFLSIIGQPAPLK